MGSAYLEIYDKNVRGPVILKATWGPFLECTVHLPGPISVYGELKSHLIQTDLLMKFFINPVENKDVVTLSLGNQLQAIQKIIYFSLGRFLLIFQTFLWNT